MVCGSGPSPPSNSTVRVASSRPWSDSHAEIAERRALSACSSPSERTYGFSSRPPPRRCRYGSRAPAHRHARPPASPPRAVPIRLELVALEQRVRLGVLQRDPLELDEEEEALEVGGPVAGESREVGRLGVRRIRVLASGGVEVDARDVLGQLVELVEQLPQPLGAARTHGAAPPLREVACAVEQIVPVAARLLAVRLEVAQIPTDPGRAEG